MSFLIDLIRAFIDKMLALLSFSRKTITNTLSIYVKTNTGRTLSVNLEPQWDIKNVKELVAPQLGLQPEEVKIIFAGKELSDATTIEVRKLIASKNLENKLHPIDDVYYIRNVIWDSKVFFMRYRLDL